MSPVTKNTAPIIVSPTDEDRKFEKDNADFLGLSSTATTTTAAADYTGLSGSSQLAADDVPAMNTDNVVQMVSILNRRIEDLNDLMKAQVLRQHAVLLQQVTGLRKLDGGLQNLEQQVSRLKERMVGLQTKLRIPYEQVILYDTQLRNLQEATRMVRAVTKYLQLVKRLCTHIPNNDSDKGHDNYEAIGRSDAKNRSKMATNVDYTLAALTLRDIDSVLTQHDLRGINVVEPSLSLISQKRNQTEKEANRLLLNGIEKGNQTDVANSLQIMFNLGTLTQEITRHITGRIRQQERLIADQLDPDSIQMFVQQHNARAVKVDGSDRTGITAVFWDRLEVLLNSVNDAGTEIHLIERVLKRKKTITNSANVSDKGTTLTDSAHRTNFASSKEDNDSTGKSVFLDSITKELNTTPMNLFWKHITLCLGQALSNASSGSNVIKRILKSQYPRLAMMLQSKLESSITSSSSVSASASRRRSDMGINISRERRRSSIIIGKGMSETYESHLLGLLLENVLESLETEYTNDVSQRLLDSARRCFVYQIPFQQKTSNIRISSPILASKAGNTANSSRAGSGSDRNSDSKSASGTTQIIVPQKKHVLSFLRSIRAEIDMVKSSTRLLDQICYRAVIPSLEEFIDTARKGIEDINTDYPNIVNIATTLDKKPNGDKNTTAAPILSVLLGLYNSIVWLGHGLIQIQSHIWIDSIQHQVNTPISDAITNITDMINSLISKIMESAKSEVQNAIRGMSRELTQQQQSTNNNGTDSETSEYLTQIENTFQWIQEIISIFEYDMKSQIFDFVQTELLDQIVRRICLITPLPEPLKLRITGDVSKIEFICNQLVSCIRNPPIYTEFDRMNLKVNLQSGKIRSNSTSSSGGGGGGGGAKLRLSDCGDSYLAFRAIRQLLFTENSKLVELYNDGILSSIPVYDMLNHIWARIGSEIVSSKFAELSKWVPYLDESKWKSIDEFVEWLNGQLMLQTGKSSETVSEFHKNALDRCKESLSGGSEKQVDILVNDVIPKILYQM